MNKYTAMVIWNFEINLLIKKLTGHKKLFRGLLVEDHHCLSQKEFS
jgi:hypothetical protein